MHLLSICCMACDTGHQHVLSLVLDSHAEKAHFTNLLLLCSGCTHHAEARMSHCDAVELLNWQSASSAIAISRFAAGHVQYFSTCESGETVSGACLWWGSMFCCCCSSSSGSVSCRTGAPAPLQMGCICPASTYATHLRHKTQQDN